jgi:hypothetical protein
MSDRTYENSDEAPLSRLGMEPLVRAMNAAELAEARVEIEAHLRASLDEERRLDDEVAAAARNSADETRAARGHLRAMGIQGVVEARRIQGRSEEPWTSLDADIAYSAADLFLTAAGLGATARAQTSLATIARRAEAQLDPGVEKGIAASAKKEEAK